MSIVYSEFRSMVETRFGNDIARQLLGPAREGGKFCEQREMHELMARLSKLVHFPVRDLWRVYGTRLYARSVALQPARIDHSKLESLASLDATMHPEVRSLYSELSGACLTCEQPEPDLLVMTYASRRSMADLLEGLIRGCVAQLHERVYVRREDVETHTGTGARFLVTRAVAHARAA